MQLAKLTCINLMVIVVVANLPTSASARVLEAALGIEARVNEFVGMPSFYQSIDALDLAYGTHAQAADQAWSGSYWPFYLGSIASPYAVKGFDNIDFLKNLTFYKRRISELKRNYDTLSAETIDQLSPSEKYDLYLADSNFSLTSAIWKSLSAHQQQVGEVASWEGSCHGWAPASAFVKRPAHLIQMESLDGKYKIPFYPDDVKALTTLLWANSSIQNETLVEGERCHTDEPNKDINTGRVTDLSCMGVNPGVWHLSIVGLIGAQKKSFVMNRANGTQIWNQPIVNYSFTYFNPVSKVPGDLKSSLAALNLARDDLHAFRSREARYFVGVQMSVVYTSESVATHMQKDSDAWDNLVSIDFTYELELDASRRIVGGEWAWYKDMPSSYPGFMWRFESLNPLASTPVDGLTPEPFSAEYTSPHLIPLSVRAARLYARDPEKPQPLAKVVRYLNELAASPEGTPSP